MQIRKTRADKIFNVCNYTFIGILMILCVYPLWYVLIGSFSDTTSVSMGTVVLFPKGFNIEAYKQTFATENIWISYLNTIFYSFVGTALSLLVTALGAYPLSKKRLMGRKWMTLFISITMWFSAGMMPTYIIFNTLGLINTRIGVLLQGLISTFYVIIMRTAFEGVPDSLEESMKLDGAGDIQIFIHCYLPLTVPTLMTLALYYFVIRWNAYLWPMILIRDNSKVPLQVILKKLLVEMQGLFENMESDNYSKVSQQTVVYSTMIISVVPMLVLYPFIQKFFVKGITLGAVKG